MTEATFDTGALVRLQRDRRRLRAVLELAEEEGLTLLTSAVALVEFLGGSPREGRAAADWIVSHFNVPPVSQLIARRASTLIRSARDSSPHASPGAADACVVAEAERRGSDVVISGDRRDFDALAEASGHVRIVDIEDLIT